MKIIIDSTEGRTVVSMESKERVKKSEILEVLSSALCSTTYQLLDLPKDLPEAVRNSVIKETAELAASAVKLAFLGIASGETGTTTRFYGKEAAFMKGLILREDS